MSVHFTGTGPDYEMRISRWIGHVELRFVRRPVSRPPNDGQICFVDGGTERGYSNGQTVAIYKGGRFTNDRGKPLRFEPTFWTSWDG